MEQFQLTDEQLAANATRFVELVESIEIPGANIPGLLEFLQNTDFFVAPASTKYHGSIRGGLVLHSLEVYDNLLKLVETFKDDEHPAIDPNSLKVAALFHDLSKMNYYKLSSRNEKEYKADGKQVDALGRFNWNSIIEYKTIEADSRFVCVDHDVNSAFLINQFIPLTQEEFAAIANHSGGMTNKFSNADLNTIFKVYPLALFLHLSDMYSCYYKQI